MIKPEAGGGAPLPYAALYSSSDQCPANLSQKASATLGTPVLGIVVTSLDLHSGVRWPSSSVLIFVDGSRIRVASLEFELPSTKISISQMKTEVRQPVAESLS